MTKLSRIARKALLNPGLIIGSLIVLAFAVVALAAPVIAPPKGQSPYLLPRDGFDPVPQPPGPGHPLGTMARQYDIFYGLVWGTRLAFWIGLSATLGRALLGMLLGLVSGYMDGPIDALIMRVTDAFMAFPIMAVAMVVVALFGGPARGMVSESHITLTNLVEPYLLLTLILFGWMPYARVMRGNILLERNKEYVQSAIAVGAPGHRILFRHLFPNATQGLFVFVASDIGAIVVLISVFSYLGLTQGSWGLIAASWGEMLNHSRDWVVTPSNAFEYWYTFVPPSAAILLFSMGWNLVGDGLRDILDPRLTGSRA